MSTVVDIEKAIEKLPPAELARLREWFAKFDAERWDQKFEQDVAAGKLDALAAEATGDNRRGLTTHRRNRTSK